MKDGHVDPRREGNFGGPLRRERGHSRQAHANKLREGDRNLRPGGQGSPNGRCCFSGGEAASASGIVGRAAQQLSVPQC